MTPAHPQWRRVLHLVRAGDVGEVRAIVGAFSYDNRDPANIRNREAMGGGGLMDIGCYLVHVIGTRGRIEIEIPFNAPPNRPCRLFLDRGGAPGDAAREVIEVAVCDQYTLQGD